MTIRTLLSSTMLALVAAPAFADNPPPAVPGQPLAATAVEPFRAKSILGATIRLQGGNEAGTVDDIVFGNDGQVDYLIVNNNGKLVSVPWDAARFDVQARTATLTLTPQQYQVIPTFTVEQYPSFYTPAYRTQVYKWYNLNPSQQRRLERRVDRRD